MANAILALEAIESQVQVLGDQLAAGVSVSSEELTQVQTMSSTILEEFRCNYSCKETRDGTIKTATRRKTGFHKPSTATSVARQLVELNGVGELSSDRGPVRELTGAAEEGHDDSPDYPLSESGT